MGSNPTLSAAQDARRRLHCQPDRGENRRLARASAATAPSKAMAHGAAPSARGDAAETEHPFELPESWHPLRSHPTMPVAEASTMIPCVARYAMHAFTSDAWTN